MRDFTSNIYGKLLDSLRQSGFEFQTFRDFIREPLDKVVILRHDVDKKPANSLQFAKVEHDKGIKASYYFRVVPVSLDINIIKEIYSLNHEIGYHYEDLDLCNGDIDRAFTSFKKHLTMFRSIGEIDTICMHGSPLSKYDNRDIWKIHSYKELGVIGEPYFDLDYSRVFYLTDTGRKWNNAVASIRDKVNSEFQVQVTSTEHLINLTLGNQLPAQLMINTHPQRWNNSLLMWTSELVMQNIKNLVKQVIVKKTWGQ